MRIIIVSAALTAALIATGAQAQMGSYGGSSSSSQSASSPSASSSPVPAGKITKDVGVALSAAQDAIGKQDFATALAQIKAAQAVSGRTDFDDFNINRFLAAVSANTHDFAAAATAYDAAIASPYFAGLSADEQKADYHNATIISEAVEHWPQVISYGQKLEAMKGLDDLTMTMMAIAYYKTNDTADAQKYAQMAVDTAKAAGKQPQANATIILGNIQGKTDPDAARRAIEQLILNTNNADDWSRIIDDAMSKKSKSIDALFLFRLRDMVGVMRSDDYVALASLASQFHCDKEVVTVLDQGIGAGKITAAQAGKLSSARSAAAKDAGVLSQVAAAAQRAKSGKDALSLGEDYWGYGRYSDAAAMAQMALQKGGLSDPGEARLLLGSAEAAEGKYTEAQATLAQVTGDFARTRAAQLWSLYAQVKAKGAQPSSAPAPQPAGH